MKSKNEILEAVRALPAYEKLIKIGVRENTTDRQEKHGTLSFLTPKGVTAIHSNGTIRRSWASSWPCLSLGQSPVIRNLMLEDMQDWTIALDIANHHISYANKSSKLTAYLDESEILINYAKDGSKIRSKYDKRRAKLFAAGHVYPSYIKGVAQKSVFTDLWQAEQSEMRVLLQTYMADVRLIGYHQAVAKRTHRDGAALMLQEAA